MIDLSLSTESTFQCQLFIPTRPSLTESESAIGKPWPCDSDIPWQGALKRLTPLLTARAHTYLWQQRTLPASWWHFASVFAAEHVELLVRFPLNWHPSQGCLPLVTKAGASQFLRLPPFLWL